MKKGAITVFLSLTITIMLSLILALLQSARIGAIKMKTECAADISMNSVLAEFNRALFEQYDLMMVDCSYQSASPSIANVEEHLRYFMQGNFKRSLVGGITGSKTMTAAECSGVNIPAYSFATDGNGAVLRRQILAYMEGEPLTEVLAEATDNLGTLSANGYDTRDVEEEAARNREILDNYDYPERETEDGEEEEPIPDNPADAVEAQKGLGVVNLAAPDPSAISTVKVDLSQFTSHRQKNRGTGLDDTENLSITEQMLINQYMIEKTGSFTDPKENSLLQYELEYLIAGKDSDFDNLEHCGRILLFWREAANIAYLTSDGAKMGEAELLATAIATAMLVPELIDVFKWSIVFAWTFAESINDIRILYEGGRVPLIKTAENWHMSLSNLAFFRDNLGGSGDKGLTYNQYLHMMLLLVGMDEKTDRLCDLMEMDIRRTPGNEHFRLDWCLDVYQAEVRVKSRIGFQMKLIRTYGYEERGSGRG